MGSPSDQSPGAPPDKMKIFISYPHEDTSIAQILQAAFLDLDRARLDVFLDRTHIIEGKQISSTILNALTDTVFFIGIGTDVGRGNFAWCGVELGYFLGTNRNKGAHTTCIYHDKVPELFHEYRCVKMMSLEHRHATEFGEAVVAPQHSEIHELLTRIANSLNSKFPQDDAAAFFRRAAEWSLKWSSVITQTYFESLQTRVKGVWYPQKRVAVSVADPDFWRGGRTIPNDATVELGGPLYGLLDMAVPSHTSLSVKTWKDLRDIVHQQTGGDILCELISEVIFSVLPFKAEAQNDLTFIAPDGQRYRVILVRHSVYGNGRRDFVINMVQTLKRDYGGDERTSILAAAIMLSAKFRFLFLEEKSRYARNAFDLLNEDDFIAHLRQMLQDMKRINAEAAEEGFADQESLIKLFGNGQEVRSLFQRWWPPVTKLEEAASSYLKEPSAAAQAAVVARHREMVGAIAPVNTKFTALALQAYQALTEAAPDRGHADAAQPH
jgi:hypothetical protein